MSDLKMNVNVIDLPEPSRWVRQQNEGELYTSVGHPRSVVDESGSLADQH
jgi:hypothetical protein